MNMVHRKEKRNCSSKKGEINMESIPCVMEGPLLLLNYWESVHNAVSLANTMVSHDDHKLNGFSSH